MKRALINYIKNEKFDDIYTPKYAVEPLLKYIPKNIVIWECTNFGKSKITEALKKHGCKVISTDKEENFFEYELNENYDMIITNPPYSLKDEFLERCYELGKPFCLLLPITSLEGKKRGRMFRSFGIEILVYDSRVEFLKAGNIWFNVSWFCHNVLPSQLIFTKLEKEK